MAGMADRKKRILAISSGGGHWVQMLRLRPAFEGCDVIFATVNPTYGSEVRGHRFHVVVDGTRWSPVRLIVMALQVCWLLLRYRPCVVVSTGAAPGYMAIRFGRLVGAKTLWIDSIANVEQVSLSGQKASAHADLCLTQWAHLAQPGITYQGAVL
jgi:UDP-N-acetylglucosamine:LPS N-acetylglucosamine transferase